MKTYEFGICGAFDFEEKATGGQSVKTKEFYYSLREKVGKENICILESTSYKKNPIKFFIQMIILMKECEKVIIFPAQNGIKIFAPLCSVMKRPLNTKTYYSVIGGWLAQMIDHSSWLKKYLSEFDAILVETNVMKKELRDRGLSNVVRLANFKRIKPILEFDVKEATIPIRLCYFSRVTKLKGIEDAVHVVNRINEDAVRCILDIYGPITDGYKDEFDKLRTRFKKEIKYKGIVNPSDSVRILSEYDIQLFPTHYETEGIPGSILDSYFAGVPVVASKWNSFSDLIIDGQTGIGFEMKNVDDFYRKLSQLIKNQSKIKTMKYRSLQEAQRYMSEKVMEEFLYIVRR